MLNKLGPHVGRPAQPSALPPGPLQKPRAQVATTGQNGSSLSARKGQGPQPENGPAPPEDSGPGTGDALTPGFPQGPHLTSPGRVAAAAGRPHRWPTRPGHSTASGPGTGDRKALGGQPSHYHRRSQGQVWQRCSRVQLGACHSPPPQSHPQHHTWKFSRTSFMLPLTNSSRGSFSKGGPPTYRLCTSARLLTLLMSSQSQDEI